MTVVMQVGFVTSVGGWLLLVPLGLASLASVGATLWFLRRSRGRRLVPAEPADPDRSVR